MNIKLFFSTFLLIFLAELGDKTQLTALARSAAGDKWTVFFAASFALVFSTLVAVLFGGTIRKYVPETYIKLTAGILFIIFGVITLYGVVSKHDKHTQTLSDGKVISKAVFQIAAAFEQSAADDYYTLANNESNPELKKLFQVLAEEETDHLNRMLMIKQSYSAKSDSPDKAVQLPDAEALYHDVSKGVSSVSVDVLKHAIEHEKATAGFYAELSKHIIIPSVKKSLTALSEEENKHAEKLTLFLKSYN
jgi:rubrerythrin